MAATGKKLWHYVVVDYCSDDHLRFIHITHDLQLSMEDALSVYQANPEASKDYGEAAVELVDLPLSAAQCRAAAKQLGCTDPVALRTTIGQLMASDSRVAHDLLMPEDVERCTALFRSSWSSSNLMLEIAWGGEDCGPCLDIPALLAQLPSVGDRLVRDYQDLCKTKDV